MTGVRTDDPPRLAWWRCAGQMTPTDRRNSRRFNAWALAWMTTFVLASLALSRQLVPAGPLRLAAALVPTALGLVVVWAYLRFLREADELVRKVQLEGAALGFGVGVVFMIGYRLLERVGAPHLDVSDPIMPMVFAWALGQAVAWKRYS